MSSGLIVVGTKCPVSNVVVLSIVVLNVMDSLIVMIKVLFGVFSVLFGVFSVLFGLFWCLYLATAKVHLNNEKHPILYYHCAI